eukprot:g8842.t1
MSQVRSLGSGSCGEVSLVRRAKDGRCFALKEVPIGFLGAAEQRRVLEELRLHKAFDCPCVVRYFTSWMQEPQNRQQECATGSGCATG